MFEAATITDPNLPTVVIRANNHGGFDLYVETVNGDGRFLSLNPAGGHYEITVHKSLPDGNHLELDEDGYPVVHHD